MPAPILLRHGNVTTDFVVIYFSPIFVMLYKRKLKIEIAGVGVSC